MIHDLVIRIITKYLYGNNQTLANLHLVSRRFYKIREMFASQIAYVTLSFKMYDYCPKEVQSVVLSFLLVPTKKCIYKTYSIPVWYHKKNYWINLRNELLSCNGEYMWLYGGENFVKEYPDSLDSIYLKSYLKCLSKIINDPRCWVS